MALLNTAYQLARWGRNVLMVDVDLEAPGLTLFLNKYLRLRSEQPGFIEFFEVCKQDLLRRFHKDQSIQPLRYEDLGKFWDLVRIDNPERSEPEQQVAADSIEGQSEVVAELRESGMGRGQLALMPTGVMSEQYVTDLQKLDFYQLFVSGIGYPIALECQAWLKNAPFDQQPFDYIFIDSRTGYNESSGLCINALADALVILTALNVQNLEGTQRFLQELGLIPDKPIKIIFVISPTPPAEEQLKIERIDEFKRLFKGADDVYYIPYHPRVALLDEVFVAKYPDSELAKAYLEFARAILKLNNDDVDSLLNFAREELGKKDYHGVLNNLKRAVLQYPTRVINELRFYLANLTDLDAPLEWVQDAYELLLEWTKKDGAVYYEWAQAMATKAEHDLRSGKPEPAHKAYAIAFEQFSEAAKLLPDLAEILNEWAVALGTLAEMEAETGEVELARAHFQEAFDKYAQAFQDDSKFYEALYNWGSHLGAFASLEAKQRNIETARNSYEAAFAKYERAVQLDPEREEALQNWAADLTAFGEMEEQLESSKDSGRSYREAYNRFVQVVKSGTQ